MCWLQNMSPCCLDLRANPRDWKWEQERKRTETNPLNQALFSILGLVLGIFHYKHLTIWFSNLGSLALHNRDFLSPLPRGKQISPKEGKKKCYSLRFEYWLCCKTSHKLEQGLWRIHPQLLWCKQCRDWHKGTYGHLIRLGTSHPTQGSGHLHTHAHT